MRPSVILAACVIGGIVTAGPARGQTTNATDSAAIHRVLTEYVEGWRAGDVPRLRRVLAPAGVILWQAPDTLRVQTFEPTLASRRPNPGYGEPWRLESLSIANGSVATARLWIQTRTVAYVDMLGLYKSGGDWLIVTKTYTVLPDTGR